MSNIRPRGITYLNKVFDYDRSDFIKVSKFYSEEESRTKDSVWWFDIPIKRVKNNPDKNYFLLGEKLNGEFAILRVPNKFFIENLENFDTKYNDNIRLHLGAEDNRLYIDERGSGQVDFTKFELLV